MNNQILFIDTVTGGLDPTVFSIISFAAVFWRDGEIAESMQVFIQETPFVSDPESMKINKVDVGWLQRNGLSVMDAVDAIQRFIKRNSDGSGPKLQLAGHNVGFDVGFLKRLFALGGGEFESWFSHRTIDTSAILSFLAIAQKIDVKTSSSSAAFDHFGIEFSPGERHTALADAVATAKLFNCLLGAVSK